jgi:uncharacterized membrane protein YjgN (DUF898 family)
VTDDQGPASEAAPSERGEGGTEPWLAAEDGVPPPGRPLELRFTGSSSEYFRIWITNLCLTLLTFGVFSAWAKVRKKRYLYSNTLLDGSPFEYLGRPIPILKGRIVAAILFGVWFVVTSLYGRFEWFVLGPAFVVLPWLIVQSVSFNARNSAFRNMTFDFRGSYMDALRMLAGTALITVGTFGLGFGALHHRLNRFFVQNLRFGGARGAFYAKGAPYVKAYLKAGVAVLLLVLLAGLVVFRAPDSFSEGSLLGLTIVVYALYVWSFAYTRTIVVNTTWKHTELGPVAFESRLRTTELLSLYLTNAVLIVVSLGLLIPYATLRALRYRISRLRVFLHGDLDEFRGAPRAASSAVAAETVELFELDISL